MSINLVYHTHVPVNVTESGVYIPGFIASELNEYSRHYEQVVLLVYQALESEIKDCNVILNPSIKVVILGLHESVPKRILKSFHIIKNVFKSIDNDFVLLVRAPTPLIIPFALMGMRKKMVVYLVGDYTQNISDLRFGFVKNKLIVILAYVVDVLIKYILRNRPFLTNSQQLFDKYSKYSDNGKIIKSSTLTKHSFYSKETAAFPQVLKGLFIGRVDYSKGIAELVEAINILYSQNIIIELTIVGPVLRNNPDVKTFVIEKFKGLDFLKNIKFIGEVSFGEDLFNLYRNSDFFILPSKSEGFPRVIWEAFANDLPVICSKVGSIPHFLNDGVDAIFIHQVTPQEIAKSIIYLKNNPENVRSIVKNGKKLAMNNTVENQVKSICDFIELNFQK